MKKLIATICVLCISNFTIAETYKIAFGSCLDQDYPQPIWDSIKKENINSFVFLGDNVYGDVPSGNLIKMKDAYKKQKKMLPKWLYEKFIDEINADGIDEIADCSFAIYQNNAFDIIPKETTSSDFNKIEILRCTYNDSYNYGTFKISIDRFVNHIQKLDIPYSLSYVEDKSLKNSFFWINTFYQKQYKDSLLASWVTNRDSIEIKDEFTENATCLDSSVYKSYDLL